MSFKKILITLDGSRLAEQALRTVGKIADEGAEIHLLSVMSDDFISSLAALPTNVNYAFGDADGPWPSARPSDDPEAVRARLGYLEEVIEELCQGCYKVTAEVKHGKVVDTILDVARNNYDVILMATHGRTGLEKVALGSVAEGVLRKAPCPVVILSPYASGEK